MELLTLRLYHFCLQFLLALVVKSHKITENIVVGHDAKSNMLQ